MSTAALIVAAGRGLRAGGGQVTGIGTGTSMGSENDLPKQYRHIGGAPVLFHTLALFAAHSGIKITAVVIHPDYTIIADELIARIPGAKIILVDGSDTRQKSVLAGLEALKEYAPDHVLIHDGARPFVDKAICDRVLAGLEDYDGVIPALAIADTLKRVKLDDAGAPGELVETVDRNYLYGAQTPQGFRYDRIFEAHKAAALSGIDDFTDDASIGEWRGLSIALVEGHRDNQKITTADDLIAADLKLISEAALKDSTVVQMEYRNGSGFDVHRFDEARSDSDGVILCGVKIPHTCGLKGHSDADVGLHALTDAILGAIGQGDIGTHFPPSDMRWSGAASDQFLKHAADLVRQRHGKIVHVDVTLICEAPKIGPHRPAMTERLCEILELTPDRVSIKATTTEGLGFAGRKEGIAALASASIALPI